MVRKEKKNILSGEKSATVILGRPWVITIELLYKEEIPSPLSLLIFFMMGHFINHALIDFRARESQHKEVSSVKHT